MPVAWKWSRRVRPMRFDGRCAPVRSGSCSPRPKALKGGGPIRHHRALGHHAAQERPEFKKLVDEEMKRLITSREIYPIYDKWFAQPIPPHNKPLNIPVSYLLRDFWKYPTDQVPF